MTGMRSVQAGLRMALLAGALLFPAWAGSVSGAAIQPVQPLPVQPPVKVLPIRKLPEVKPVSPDIVIPPGQVRPIPGLAAGLQIKTEKVGALSAKPAGTWNPPYTRSGTVFVLVSEKITQLEWVMPDIRRYAEDVASDGYKVFLYTISYEGNTDPFFSHARDLKSFIRGKWLKVLDEVGQGALSKNAFDLGTGVVLVGTFPLPLVHKRMATTKDDPDVPGQKIRVVYEGVMPCDLFLTDMDGNWNILDENGIPLVSTIDAPAIPQDAECVPGDEIDPYWQPQAEWGKAGARPEIWIGRIDPRPVVFSGNDVRDSLIRYFRGNHNYRAGIKVESQEKIAELTFENRLLYYDDDMEEHTTNGASMLSMPWPSRGTTQVVSSPASTRKADYMARLRDANFLWVEAFMHSSPSLHEFSFPEGSETKTEALTRTELFQGFNGQKLRALFYYHHGCSACRFSEQDNLGESYLFNRLAVPPELHPLAVLGNASVGPHDTAQFYAGLMYGLNIGQAQMFSQRGFARSSNWPTTFPAFPGRVDPKRYYNQTLLGDPTLRPRPFSPALAPTPPNLPQVYDTMKSQMANVFLPNPQVLKNRALAAATAPSRRVGKLTAGKPFPVGRGGIVLDPDWSRLGIPGLKKRLSID